MKNHSCTPVATAVILGGPEAPQLRGTVEFYARTDGTLVVAELQGLPQQTETGFWALHIHEGCSCLGADFSGTGGHFNPDNSPHPRHAGDLPPLLSVCGKAYMAVLTGRFHPGEIIGKTVVIHSGPDDFSSQPAGNPGRKIGCGVIRRVRK